MAKDIEVLKEIVKHNNRLMDTVGHDFMTAMERNLEIYIVEDKETKTPVYDFFKDITLSKTVDPYEEYDKGQLDNIIQEWKSK